MQEEWKSVVGYEGYYEISNFGRAKSLDRKIYDKNGIERKMKGRLLKQAVNCSGYLSLVLCKERKEKSKTIHSLVWDAFGEAPRNGHRLQVDHIDNNKLNNRIDNLQLLNNRDNTNKGRICSGTNEEHIGTYFREDIGKWVARIRINNKYKYLGIFILRSDAHKEYLKAKKLLHCQDYD